MDQGKRIKKAGRIISLMNLIKYIKDFINLLYPENCRICRENLLQNEKIICLKCQYDLPKADIEDVTDNIVSKLFWGRVNITNAYSLFLYQKGGKFQSLIHQLKYRGDKEIGFELGRILGIKLKNYRKFDDIDVIIPVPLHKKKLRKRGYNQSDCIAEGLHSVIGKPVDNDNLIRVIATNTQTNKTRFERFKNVSNIFDLKNPEILKNKHILLIDDIVTTGSTLESCILTLQKINNVEISISTLAVA